LNAVANSGALAAPLAVRLHQLRSPSGSRNQPFGLSRSLSRRASAIFAARWTSELSRRQTKLQNLRRHRMPCAMNAASRRLPDLTRLPAIGILLLLAVAVAPVNGFAQGVYTQTYLPSAYGTSAFVGNTVLVGQTAPASLAGYCGTSQEPLSASFTAAGVTLLPLITGGAVNTTVSSAAQQAQAEADTTTLSLLGGLISAQEITAVSTTTVDDNGNFHVSAVGSTFNHLVVLGHVYNGSVAPNTRINLPLLGYIMLNEQTSSIASSNATMTVNMIHVHISVGNLLGLQVGTEIIVSNATSGIYNELAPGIIAGGSFGSQVLGSLLNSTTTVPEVLPCQGTNGAVATNTQVGITVPGILNSGTVVDTAESNLTPAFSSGENTSTIQGLNLLSGLITASVLRAQVDASVDENFDITLNGQDSYVGIAVAGHPEITDDIPANTSVPLLGLGTLYLKRIINLSSPPGIEVRSLELEVDQNNAFGLPIGLDVIVGDAYITIIRPYQPPM
jgi:hypothetical protein